MALTRGVLASFPCPVCLVPRDMQSRISALFTLRDTWNMEQLWRAAQAVNATQREDMLRGAGLRDVEVLLPYLHFFVTLSY